MAEIKLLHKETIWTFDLTTLHYVENDRTTIIGMKNFQNELK